MSSTAENASYVIKTKDGDKGPFSRRQICKLVVKGQLQESVSVRDTESNRSVLVADIVSGQAYHNEFEDEALGVASDLLEADVYHAAEPVAQTPPKPKDDNATVTTNRHRRMQSQTQTQRRRNSSSRIFDSEIVEGVQRSVRSNKRGHQQQMMLFTGGIVALCAIVALVLIMMPSQSVQGVWTRGNQTLTIGQTVIKLKEGDVDLINAYYKQLDDTTYTTTWFVSRKDVTIRVTLAGDTLTTVFDGTDTRVWARQK